MRTSGTPSLKSAIEVADTAGGAPPMRNTFLVTYDICEDKRLAKVHKIMRGYGDHLQYSVFECQLAARFDGRVPRLRSRGPIEAGTGASDPAGAGGSAATKSRPHLKR